MSQNDIPKATARRLPLYQRAFNSLAEVEKEKVSSAELSEILQIDSTTIRRDFSYFGALGRRGYGYDVSDMQKFFDQLMNSEEVVHVAIVGVGNLGEALLRENSHSQDNIRMTAGFDIKDHLINTIREGIPIYSMEDLETQLPKLGIKTAVLTVPNEHAQQIADRLVDGGCRGILNFTSIPLSVPSHVLVHSVNLGNELKILNYFMDNYQ
ncbi:MAG: redox-sensing transcriptional repressor Rex [Atopococcus tabaci]|uniref:Redox-sensing transcriptional repressor Rex n=1 Tax=Atopococcus tabaci TaxID=269774 RepID=A0AA43UCB1_9LACT|nr:redox-sensing transcriptional repressor Rex [Atopococcus tabaci]